MCMRLDKCVSACTRIYVHHNIHDCSVQRVRINVSSVMSPEAYLHFMQREEVKQLHVVASLQLLEVHSAYHTVKERERMGGEGRKR